MKKSSSWKQSVTGAVLVVLAAALFLSGCEEAPVTPPKPPGPPGSPGAPPAAVDGPTFGGLWIPDQVYKSGEAIAPLTLPAAYSGKAPLGYGISLSVVNSGFSFDWRRRVLSGTPHVAGRYDATYRVTDVDGASESLSFTITVTDETGTLDVRSDPAGAVIHLNAVDTGRRTPAVIEVPAGTHEVMMVKSGFVPVLTSARVNAGQQAQVSGTFEYATGLGDEEPDVPAAPDDLPPLFGDRSLRPASHVSGTTEFLDRSPYFPPVGYQGAAPSCAYFATAYLASYMITAGNHLFNGTGEDEIADMSPGFLWTVERPRAGYGGAFDRLERYGISSESKARYLDHMTCFQIDDDFSDTACWEPPTDQAKTEALEYKASIRKVGWFLTTGSVTSRNQRLRSILRRGYAVALSVRSCNLAKAGGSSPYLWGKKEARCPFNWNDYHAVVLVGYDHDKGPHGAFKFINSWGEAWGDDGYGWMGYDIPQSNVRAAYVLYPVYDPWPPIPGEPGPEPPEPEPIRWKGTGTVADKTYAVDQRITAVTLPEATGGTGTLSYRLRATGGSWPLDLDFDEDTRLLSGTPRADYQGTYNMRYTVTDSEGETLTSLFTITVNPTEPPEPEPPKPGVLRGRPIGIAVDKGKLYWSAVEWDHNFDFAWAALQRSNLNGTVVEDVAQIRAVLRRLEVHDDYVYWSAFPAYYTDPSLSGVFRTPIEGHTEATFARIGRAGDSEYNTHAPYTIHDNKVYWLLHHVWRSDLDGSRKEAVVRDVSSLSRAIRVYRGKVYWSDVYGYAQRANLDGTGLEDVELTRIFGITFDRGKIYYSTGETIGRANLDGTGNGELIRTDGGFVDLAIGGGKMYFIEYYPRESDDFGIQYVIRSANLDGSVIRNVHTYPVQ